LEEKSVKLFSEKNLVFIATIMKDGSPQVSPVWANYEDGYVLINTAEGRIKHKMFYVILVLQYLLYQKTIHLI